MNSMESFRPMSVQSRFSTAEHNTNNAQLDKRSIVIPGIGTVIQLTTDGPIEINYNADGYKFTVLPKELGGGFNYQHFGSNHYTHYNSKDELPLFLKDKLHDIPVVLKYLDQGRNYVKDKLFNDGIVNSSRTPLTKFMR